MFHRKDAAVALAVSALLAGAGYAVADTPTVTLDAAGATPAEAAPQGLLMQGLDRLGVGKTLADQKIKVYGWGQVGYLYNPNRSDADGPGKPGEGNVGHIYTANPRNDLLLNQLSLVVERGVDLKKFDFGGKVWVMYGTDARYIHAYGESWYDTDTLDRPYAQFDFPEYYVDVAAPVGNGIKFRAGKMVSHLGLETLNPTTTPFYSHSYIYNFGGPTTESGVFAMYKFNDQWSSMIGITRGDDVSLWKDNNDTYKLVGQVGWVPMKGLQMYLNVDLGWDPSVPDTEILPDSIEHTNAECRQIYNIVAKYDINEKWSVGLDAMLGCEKVSTAAGANTGSDNWYGLAFYTGYVFNDYVTFNARAEWFRDRGLARFIGGTAVGYPELFDTSDISVTRNYQDLYEITLGATITPMPKSDIGKNLKIRPEIRYDMAQDRIFSGGSNTHQVTIGGDLIFTF